MIAKLLIVFLVYVLSFGYIYSQNDYIAFYNLCNEGDEQAYLKNFPLAIAKYDSAFRKVDFIGVKYLIKYARISSKVDKNKSMDALRLALMKGMDINGLKHWGKHFPNESRFTEIKDSAVLFNGIYNANINTEYARAIDSLEYIDQCIIRKNCERPEIYEFKGTLPKNIFDLDSSVFECLLNLIGVYGFPSEKRIGRSANKVWVIFHHNVRIPKNEKYLSMLDSALKKGEYEPEFYAWMYDQLKINKSEKPFFYYGVADIVDLTDEEKKHIDIRRSLFGIKPLRSKIITKTKGSIEQSPLW